MEKKLESIDYTNWFKRDSWTILQAAYICHGIEPNDIGTIESLNSFSSRYEAVNHYEIAPTPITLKNINDVLQILESVDYEISNSAIPTSKLIEIIRQKELDETGILLKEWSKFTNKQNPLPSEPKGKDCPSNKGSDSYFGQLTIEAFDPLTITGIASLFDSVTSYNTDVWKTYASKAKSNGLSISRTKVGTGSAESKFNPVLVANWLIAKKGTSAEKLERKLKNNLPERSHDNREDIFGI